MAIAAAGCVVDRSSSAGKVHRSRGPVVRLEEPAPGGTASAPAPPEETRLALFPAGPLLYDPYLAAQRQSRTAIKVQLPVGIEDHARTETTVGLDRSLLRWTREDRPEAGTELEFEAAVFARFDLEDNYDMDASDWRFGLPLVHRDGDLAWKIHLSHMTSHLGDEFIADTGRKQTPYHIDEAAAGVSWDAGPGTRLYGEAATAIYARSPAGNGRVEAGWEWVGPKWTSGLAPYAALDLQARNEQDWTPAATAAVGIAFGRHFRFGLDYFRGRDSQTQFLEDRVSFLSIGVSLDY